MRQIFRRTWVYVGHDTEVPNPGDYKMTYIGTESVVLVRGTDGKPYVLLNRCSHRGATVCQVSRGTAKGFRCQYHGWSFGLDGHLSGVPFPDGYPALDPSEKGLWKLPKVEAYRGFVFASFSSDVPALIDHLGKVTPYIDLLVDHADGYEIQVAPDANEVLYNGNWKLSMENSIDGYHLSFTHQSVFAVMEKRTGKPSRYLSSQNEGLARSLSFSNGHTVMDLHSIARDVLRNRLDALSDAPPSGADLDAFFGIEGAEEIYLSTTGPGVNTTVYPNLQLGSPNICEVHPISVDRTRIVLRPLLLRGAPDNINSLRLRYHEIGSGPCGFVQPDDLEMFERVSSGIAAESVEWLLMDRGVSREILTAGGSRASQITDEGPQRAQYRRWRELMGAQ